MSEPFLNMVITDGCAMGFEPERQQERLEVTDLFKVIFAVFKIKVDT